MDYTWVLGPPVTWGPLSHLPASSEPAPALETLLNFLETESLLGLAFQPAVSWLVLKRCATSEVGKACF